jgi:predicted transglutaminase-like cysteine proteinase
MRRVVFPGVLITSLLFLGIAPAMALPGAGGSRLRDLAHGGTTMGEGSFTAAHAAFSIFCETYPSQCLSDSKPGVVELDEQKKQDLIEVNNEVNGRIAPDVNGRDFDHWSLEANLGHCNEYAIQKRKALIDRGFPTGALSLTVAHTRFDEGNILHLVLTVRTDKGDLVLDNLRHDIVPWNRTGYGWVMRQSSIHPMLWVSLTGAKTSKPIEHDI